MPFIIAADLNRLIKSAAHR